MRPQIREHEKFLTPEESKNIVWDKDPGPKPVTPPTPESSKKTAPGASLANSLMRWTFNTYTEAVRDPIVNRVDRIITWFTIRLKF